MEILRVIVLSLFILLELSTLSRGCPSGRHHNNHAAKKEETAKSRSYIDIDASDPFKVPKSSHYINKPMPEFDQKIVDSKEEEEPENRKGHGRDMERTENGEEEVKNMGRGNDREAESERERGEREGRENEGENYVEKSGEVPDEHAAIMQSPMEEQTATQEEANNAPKDLDISDNAKAIEKIEQDAEGKSAVQSVDSEGLGTEEGFKKGNTDPNGEDETPIDKNVVNQMS